MNFRNIAFVSLICFSCITTEIVYAQNDAASPLNPEFVRPERFGVMVGIGGVQQSGEYNVNCDCPGFKNGAGSGYLLGGVYELESRSPYIFGINGGYHHKAFSAVNNISNDTTFTSLDNTSSFNNVQLLIKHKSEVALHELFVTPYVKVYPFTQTLFFKLGAYAGVVFSSSLNHTVSLNQSTVQLENGETVRVSFDKTKLQQNGYTLRDDGSVLLEDGAIPQLNTFQLALTPAIGAEFRLSKLVMLAPSIQYMFPLTTISNTGNSYKASSWLFLLEIHYLLRKS